MTLTRHGHHIPHTTDADEDSFVARARCGGVGLCRSCNQDAVAARGTGEDELNRKVILNRWQWDEISDILIGNVPGGIQNYMDEHFKIKTVPTNGGDIPVLYVYFGFKQELTKWRLKHGIAVKDTVLARDWQKMEGRMFKPVPVYDWGWMRNNVKHEIVLRARDIIYRAEVTFGSGPELYRSYNEEMADG